MTIRVIITERDCDHMQVVYSLKAKNKRILETKLDRIFNNAEGAVYVNRVTKAEYNEFEEEKRLYAQQFRRDLAAEQAGY